MGSLKFFAGEGRGQFQEFLHTTLGPRVKEMFRMLSIGLVLIGTMKSIFWGWEASWRYSTVIKSTGFKTGRSGFKFPLSHSQVP